MTRKIVVAEELVPAGIAALSQGYEVINAAGCSRAELIELLTDAAALVVRSGTQVTAELIGGAPVDNKWPMLSWVGTGNHD